MRDFFKKNKIKIIWFFIGFVSLFFLSPGFIFVLLLTALVLCLMKRNTEPPDWRFVFLISAAAILLRFAALLFLQNYCFRNGLCDIFGDGQDNILRGQIIADYLTGKSPAISFSLSFLGHNYNMHINTIFNGVFFALFGSDIVALKYVNILLAVITGWMAYDLSARIKNSQAGKIAMTIVLFWPTLFLWSLTGLKETGVIFCVFCILWCLNRILYAGNIKARGAFLFLLLASSAYTILLRIDLMLPLITIFLTTVIIYYFSVFIVKRKRLKKSTAVFILPAILSLLILFWKDISYVIRGVYAQLLLRRRSSFACGGLNFDLLGGVRNYYTFAFFIRYLCGGWFHFFLEPLPRNILFSKVLFIYPLIIIWYLMILLSLAGVIVVCGLRKFNDIFPSLLFIFFYAAIVGMGVANIGTIFRLRDTIIPIVAVLASFGIAGINSQIKGGRLK